MSMTHHLSRRAWFAIAAGALVALLAFAPGSWGVANGQTAGTPTVTPTTTTVNPTGTTTVTTNPGSGGSRVNLNIPANTLPAGSTVSATPPEVVDPNNLPPGVPPPPPPPAGSTTQVAAVFSLDATDPNGAPVTSFTQNVTITVDVPADVLANIPVGGSVTLARFDAASGQWQQLSCTSSGSSLSCDTSQFSLWAFIITAPEGAPLPAQTTQAPSPPDTGDGVFDTEGAGGSSFGMALGVAAVALGLTAAGGLAVARRRGS